MKRFFGNILAVIIGNLLTFTLIFGFLFVFIMFSAIGTFFQSSKIKNTSVLELTFENPIKESSMDDEFNLFASSTEEEVYFRDIIRSIEKAKEDDKIEGISLKIQSFSGGFSQLTDVRDALLDFKKSGKFIYAYSHNTNQSAYILNSTADSIFQNPLGMVFLQGLSAEVMFFKNMGDKYGIDFQVIRHGAYKSAVEPYLRDDLSEENREQLGLLLNDIWTETSTEIAKARNLSPELLNSYVDSLYSFNPDFALRYKLVDKIAHEAEYDRAIAQRLNLSPDDDLHETLTKHTVSLSDYAKTLEMESGKDKIAVLYASGTITQGEGFSGIQSEVYKNTIRELAKDDDIKAVVLRINSPGGSADAAEEILYELKQLHKKKPIIVSFGDVAASGGYYIAMEADAIFANPNTITGSIGVLGMIPNFKTMINNVGLTTDYVNTNENANFLHSLFQPLSETGLQTMTNMTEGVYSVFVHHVMNGRNMTYEEVDAVGGGRVWSGIEALKLGLIDDFGSLEDAIQFAAEKVGLEKYSLLNYPIRKGGWEEFFESFQSTKTETFLKQELGEANYQVYLQLKSMKEFNGVQVRMPFELKIK